MSDSLMSNRQMEGVPPIDQAKRAIRHALETIRDNPKVAWHLGIGTQTFALLTEAAATLYGEDVEKVRKAFLPPEVEEPPRGSPVIRYVHGQVPIVINPPEA